MFFFRGGFDFLMFGVNGVICCEKRPLGDSFKSLQSLLPMLPGTKNEEKHKKNRKNTARDKLKHKYPLKMLAKTKDIKTANRLLL